MNEYCFYEEMDAYEGWQEINEECESDGTVLWTAGKSWVVKEVDAE